MTKKSPQVSAVAPPPVNDPMRAEYTPAEAKSPRRRDRDANAEERKEDHVYGIASRQRWGGDTDVAQLHRDSMAIDSGKSGQEEEEEEEEEESSASDLTVAQLKEALEAAEVEIPANAKKAELVALYEQHDLGDAE